MTFATEFKPKALQLLAGCSLETSKAAVLQSLSQSRLSLADFATLISPAAAESLEPLGRRARQLTQQRFGKVIRLFAPLYLSNECVNRCLYCGFSRENPILRVTLTVEEVCREAQALVAQGFRNILLVSGEHPKFVSSTYVADCVRVLHPMTPSLSLEIGPMETAEYRPLVEAGADGLVVYQETYDRAVYAQMHTSGPKRRFEWRLETPERAYAAGFRRLGIGALHGLADWRFEALSLAAHAEYLQRQCWKAFLTISVPRLRPAAGAFEPLTHMTDRELVQLVCALRVMFPDVGLVLSTREAPKLRDGLIPLGITLMSAGSHTEPGGYAGAGTNVHHTRHGRLVTDDLPMSGAAAHATEQFHIADTRSAHEVAQLIRRLGYEPVWKDWDQALAA